MGSGGLSSYRLTGIDPLSASNANRVVEAAGEIISAETIDLVIDLRDDQFDAPFVDSCASMLSGGCNPTESRDMKPETMTALMAEALQRGRTNQNRNCPVGMIGSYREVRTVIRGNRNCHAHHIIQNAAVRDLPGYRRSQAPVIVLDAQSHAAATAYQRYTPEQGTYGIERLVGESALQVAGVPEPLVDASVVQANRYFNGIGVYDSTPTRPLGKGWRVGWS